MVASCYVLSNMLFYLEIWPSGPPYVQCPLSFRLLVIRQWIKNSLEDFQHLYDLKPGGQHYNICTFPLDHEVGEKNEKEKKVLTSCKSFTFEGQHTKIQEHIG